MAGMLAPDSPSETPATLHAMTCQTMTCPRSAFDLVGGLTYFARMCDKIRLHDKGELADAYHKNLGKGSDQRLCTFMGVSYDDIRHRIHHGDTDLQVLHWCMEYGRHLTDADIQIWNGFATKRGWQDDASDYLAESKAASGLQHRDDIQTMFQYFDADEGRDACPL